VILALYRLGLLHPGPGRHTEALERSRTLRRARHPRLPQPVHGRRPVALAIFALGIMPYITASIILQLLTVVSPSLEKLQKEGEVGQQRITQYTRYLTVGLSPPRRSATSSCSARRASAGAPSSRLHVAPCLLIVVCLTAGCVLLMWMGELITQRGIGNGISLMIFASIVAACPRACRPGGRPGPVFKVMMPFLALAIIAAIVFIQEGQRRIPSSTPSG
jgi:preprotein translocase subunit SecY